MTLIKGAIAAPGARIAAVGLGPGSLRVAVVGDDGAVRSSAWAENRQHSFRHRWSSLGGVRSRASGAVGLVTRPGPQVDAFVVGTDGRTYTAASGPVDGGVDGAWSGWRPILSEEAPPGAPVAGVSRAPGKVDIFVVGGDGGVYTAAWDDGGDAWRGWWRIPGLTTVPGGHVTAVSRSPEKLDAFAVADDGRVYTASWNEESADGKWRGWWPVAGGLRAEPGSRVEAVSRLPGHSRPPGLLDVFVVGNDGGVYAAGCGESTTEAAWGGWWPIGALTSVRGGVVTAVSRAPQKLDVFAVAADGEVATAAYDDYIAGSDWRGWWPVAGGRAAPGSMVSVVARTPDRLHAFVVGLDGLVWTSSWGEDPSDGVWRGWWSIPS